MLIIHNDENSIQNEDQTKKLWIQRLCPRKVDQQISAPIFDKKVGD